MELTNSGPVAAANIHLVSRTPGLLSFGKKAASDPASLFEFPLVEKNQAPLRLVQEDGTVTQVKKYGTIVTIEILVSYSILKGFLS